jgi:hypothetical protein
MKRLFYSAGIILTLGLFGSCAQHDPKAPDTSGGTPYGSGGSGNPVGVDTTKTNAGQGHDFPDMDSDRISNPTPQTSEQNKSQDRR